MEASGKLLSSRLLSLLKNGQWGQDDVVKLFKALVKEFNGRNEDFHTWMMRILHQVEIHKISVSDLTSNEKKIVDHVEEKINNIVKNIDEKTLDEIVEEIRKQADIDEEMMAQVKDIVSSVSECLSDSTAPHLQGIKESLFKLCKSAEKTIENKPRVTQMVSWCILVLSKSSRLVQVGTGEGKSCIVAMFAAYQAMMGNTPDIISSSPVLAERDAKEWFSFYKRLNITVDANIDKSETELKKCYECQVVYGTTVSFAADWLRQHFLRQDVRPNREFQCVIVDEVDSLMLDKGLEVVYLSTEIPLMESLNAILSEIWLIVNQLKRLDTGEILGPIQLLSQLLSEIITENKNIDQHSIVQMAVDTGIKPIKSSKQMQENMKNVLKQLDNASVDQKVSFLNMLVRNLPEYFFKLYQERPDGTLRRLNEISPADTNKRQEISVLLLGNGKCRVVHFEEDSMDPSLRKKIQKSYQPESAKEQNESRIPGLEDLISGKMQTWFGSALLATKLTLGHEYVLHGDGVAPVDYECTGVVQNNMQWGEGLQQFLEMKHQTKLSNMTLITNFMSNVGLFKKYKNKIYGITGTLGDQTELDMVKKLYNGIDTCKIPSFRQRKLYELEGLVIPEEDEWIRTVCNVVKHQVTSTVYRGPRAALVICETINRAEMFHKTLSETISLDKLKLYVNNNMNNSTITDSTIKAGDVIIATNLAGRGTDLKVSESVNEAGGLFVVQTFLPLNVRVEQQAFGRTARQGSPGSAQIIMCASHFSDTVKLMMGENTSLTSLHSCPDNLRKQMTKESVFEEAVNHYLTISSSQNHDAMVSALTGLLTTNSSNLEKAKDARNTGVKKRLSGFLKKDIPEITKKEELFSVYLVFLDKIYEDDVFSDQRDVIVSSLHECWGLWLLMYFNEEKSTEKSSLKEQLMLDLLSAKQKLLCKQSPSTMVYYYIRSGNNLREKGHLTESIEMFTKALEDGAYGEIIPLYNRALTTIMKKDIDYIAQALADLEKANKAIDSYKSHLAHILTCVKSSRRDQTTEGDTLLSKQFQMKCMIVDQLKDNIQDAVMKLKRAESRGGNVSLLDKHTIFMAEDSLKRAISRRAISLPETIALVVIEDFIKRGEIKQGDVNLAEKFALLYAEDNTKRAERRGGDVNLAERLILLLLEEPIHSSQKILEELIMEYEHIRSLGLDTIFLLDTIFSLRGFLSKIFR
ncbi:protein translocase subunit SecA-like [Sinocyclocheilus rhinocerous]|uniref:protein translocase subunit SecA-like n=1 Tax=Sinocyclocheilus rhinocerous TaxID=307959 RepID=UPI0007B8B751|nr:PREDICTED: protein translocase subunit SecA-like [Sinocyclocheilus rhinocerous]